MTLPPDVRLMQRGTQVLLGLCVLAAAATALSRLGHSAVFSWRVLRVEGEVVHNNATSLRTLALPRLRGNYLTTSLQDARGVFETLPWVRHAQVRRVWPHTLVVSLEEHRPVAYWEREDGDDQLVNAQGEVFEVNLGDVEDEDLPLLRGPQGSAAQVWSLYQRLQALFGARETRIERLALSERGSWRLRLEDGAVVELGRGSGDEVMARTQRFLASLPQVTARFGARQIEYADLRHHDGYALRLAGMGTTDAQVRKR